MINFYEIVSGERMAKDGHLWNTLRAAKQKIVEDLRRCSLKKESLEQHEDWRRKKTRTAS